MFQPAHTGIPTHASARYKSARAARATVAVIGDTWTLRILRSIFRGKRRYRDFIEECGVSRAVLADRLEKLQNHGVLERQVRHGRHPEYRFTQAGLDLWSLYLAMWLWEMEWGRGRDPEQQGPDVPRSELWHTDCNHVMRPELRCAHCARAVLPFDTRPEAAEASPDAQVETDDAGTWPALPASSYRRTRRDASGTAHPGAARLWRVVGDRWNTLIVSSAFRGLRLFSQFEQDLQIGSAQLSDRLGELQQLGILRAHAYAGSRQEYRLTRAGVALFPMVLEMARWGNRWLWPLQGKLFLQHVPCGESLRADWHCGHCGERVTRKTLRFV